MSFIRKHFKLIAVAASCAAIGAAASAIASAGAATGASSVAGTSHAAQRWLRARLVLRRSVHGDLIVATNTGFVHVTFDRGAVQSVSGQQLTLTEGIKVRTYKTITLTIPASARVRDNGRVATLTDVTAGQRALVVQGPDQTLVIARSPRS
jgi:hypothetical protein